MGQGVGRGSLPYGNRADSTGSVSALQGVRNRSPVFYDPLTCLYPSLSPPRKAVRGVVTSLGHVAERESWGIVICSGPRFRGLVSIKTPKE